MLHGALHFNNQTMAMWNSQNIQAVWFSTAVSGVKANAVYEQIIGEEPSSYQSNKIPNPANPFLSVANGHVGQYEVAIQVQPGRVDFILSAAVEEDGQSEGFDFIETEPAIGFIIEAVSKMTGLDCVRLALVVNIMEKTESVNEARTLIEDRVGLKPSFDDYSDYMFQINRRASFDKPSFSLNRLLRYNSLTFHGVTIDFTSGGAPSSFAERYAAAMMIDLNTVMTGRVFQKEEVDAIFLIMAGEAMRIAKSGKLSALET